MALTETNQTALISKFKKAPGEDGFRHKERVHQAIGDALLKVVDYSRPDFKEEIAPEIVESMLFLVGLIVPSGADFAIMIRGEEYCVPNSNPEGKLIIY